MFDELRKLAEVNGGKLAVVSMDNMRKLKSDMDKYKNEMDADVRNYLKWIFDDPEPLDINSSQMQSIIILAMPRPAYAKVTWHTRGKQYKAFSGTTAGAETTAKIIDAITEAVQTAGFSINRENRLFLKRMAVQSGLAQYGRNNIAYIDGMGSAFVLSAFLTDIPCKESPWREPMVSPTCDGCQICETLCPTNAIVSGKFPIDSHRCLTRLNQGTGDFPEWVPQSAHHTTYYCLMCQARCPMNKGQEIIEMSFDEEETAYILDRTSYDEAPDELKRKIARMTGFGKPETIQRNLRVLFDAMDNGHVPKL